MVFKLAEVEPMHARRPFSASFALGLTPRLLGSVKGPPGPPYRNPTRQKGFAERWGQNGAMVTSFADGSKISFEQTIVANATGFKVSSRGLSRGLQYTGDILKIGEL